MTAVDKVTSGKVMAALVKRFHAPAWALLEQVADDTGGDVILCCWRSTGPNGCQDEAVVIVRGFSLCEAHAMHSEWLRADQFRRQMDAFAASWKASDEAWEWRMSEFKRRREADAAHDRAAWARSPAGRIARLWARLRGRAYSTPEGT